MAKQSQCEICKDYQANMNLCKRKWSEVCFDDTDCDFKAGNSESLNSDTFKSTPSYVPNYSRITKRGSVRIEMENDENNSEEARDKHNPKAMNTSSSGSMRKRSYSSYYQIALFFIVLLFTCSLGFVYYLKLEEESLEKVLEKEHVIHLLDEIEQDKTLNSLKMIRHRYEGDTLVIDYFAIPNIASNIQHDSLKYEFQNMVLLYHDKWKEILNSVGDKQSVVIATFNRCYEKKGIYLGKSSTVKQIYSFNELPDSTTTTIAEINKIIDNSVLHEKAMEVFANRKIYDIEEYVRKHYGKNSLLRLHSVTLDKDFVRVALSFDDSMAKIAKSLLDSTRIDPNFKDKVGERGSILKEIFSVCSRTHRGFTIEYIGLKNGTHHTLSWNYDRTMEFKSLFKFETDRHQKSNQYGVTLVNGE